MSLRKKALSKKALATAVGGSVSSVVPIPPATARDTRDINNLYDKRSGRNVLKHAQTPYVDSAHTVRLDAKPKFWTITRVAAQKALDLYFEPLRRLWVAHQKTAKRPTL
jgi:hypothetical protein